MQATLKKLTQEQREFVMSELAQLKSKMETQEQLDEKDLRELIVSFDDKNIWIIVEILSEWSKQLNKSEKLKLREPLSMQRITNGYGTQIVSTRMFLHLSCLQ
jgi:16S rRNA C1402 N4-methylase RsmH